VKTARTELFDLPLDLVTLDEAVDYIMASVAAGAQVTQMSLNAPKVLAARKDPDLRLALQRSDLVTADGSWVAFAGRLCGVAVPERFGGIDLFEALLEASADLGRSVFFFGATEQVVRRVVQSAQERFPGLKVAGARNGYFADEEALRITGSIRAAETDLLFLGFPSPRKEMWLDEHFRNSGANFAMGVGGSFDVFAGVVPRAPSLLQRAGLEWVWRFGLEPRRMWRRYLGTAPRFALATATETVALRRRGRRRRRGHSR
jgi:N-acetylglucosaminyldiphosphoundecaprenol N-acetyl-beta-D-mannosaminyltransferase